MVKAKSQFKRRSTANNVEIIIPVPSDADTGRFKTTCGTVKYVPEKNSMIWSMKSFPVCFDFHTAMKNIATNLSRVEKSF